MVQLDSNLSESNIFQPARKGTFPSEEGNIFPGGEPCKVNEVKLGRRHKGSAGNDGKPVVTATAENVEQSEGEGVSGFSTVRVGESAMEDDRLSDVSDVSCCEGGVQSLFSLEQLNAFFG